MAVQWDARFSGYKLNLNGNRRMENGKPVRYWNSITVFTIDDRAEAIALATKEAAKHGYDEVTIDHIVRI